MAFFKFRWPGRKRDDVQAAAQPESVEVLRRRAKHRLIGAAILVLLGVIGFPLLFDTQPRPIAVDIPIEIPDKNKTKPLVIPAAPPPATKAATEPASAGAPAAGGSSASSRVPDSASLDAREEVVAAPKSEQKPAVGPVSPATPATKKRSKTRAQTGHQVR